jgi:rhodanese-related sulfurtransferase
MAAVVLALGACSSAAPAVIELSSPADSAELLQAPPPGLTVLDVRTPEEFASGRLPNAVNLDFYAPDFADRLAELDRDTPYFVYCRSGNRSASTVDTMNSLGFTEVYELAGGIQSWSQAGLEIVR